MNATPAPEVHYQAGVDEAGLGPILGPLVVAGVALAGPSGSPWRALRTVVCRNRAAKGKLRVADSKKVNQGKYGLERLEHTVLAFYGAWRGDVPANLRELLVGLGADPDALRDYPWYGDLALPLPLRVDRGLVELDAHRLSRRMATAGLTVQRLVGLPVEVAEFNALIARTDNKSHAHFDAYSRVIGDLLALLPADGHLVADRCGGLLHYVPSLRRVYPGARVEVLAETPACSSYRIATRTGPVQVSFAERAEDRAFPTALASCIAKYIRESMLQLLNRWFQERVPGLAPTAGYYTDGRRFLADIDGCVRAERIARDRLVRCR